MGLFGAGGPEGLTGGGGPMGMAGLDIAPYKMPLVGTMFQDPNELHQKQQMHQMANAYSAMRPELVEARMRAIQGAQVPYSGANAMLASMMGGGGGVSPSQMYQSPLSPRAMQIGAPRDTGPQRGARGNSGGMIGGLLGGGGGGLGGLMGGMGGGMDPFAALLGGGGGGLF